MMVPPDDGIIALPNSLRGFPRNLSQNDFPMRDVTKPDIIKAILVDDDDFYREAIATELGHLGFKVAAFPSGDAMLAHFAQGGEAEIIVLDWRLQTGLGIDLLPLLHESDVHLPVVFLTGMPAVASEFAALDLGAVDFVDKARGTAILAKRLRLIVQASRGQSRTQSPPTSGDSLRCGKLKLHSDIARAYWDGVDIELTLTEFKIVFLLVSHAGEYVTYRSVYDCVRYTGFVAGSGEDGFRTNVRSSIKRIRNKFRQLDDRFCHIENYPAFGYRWRAAPADAA